VVQSYFHLIQPKRPCRFLKGEHHQRAYWRTSNLAHRPQHSTSAHTFLRPKRRSHYNSVISRPPLAWIDEPYPPKSHCQHLHECRCALVLNTGWVLHWETHFWQHKKRSYRISCSRGLFLVFGPVRPPNLLAPSTSRSTNLVSCTWNE
jgi:hypothetical protein